MKKNILKILFTSLMAVGLLSGCGPTEITSNSNGGDTSYHTITFDLNYETSYPIYATTEVKNGEKAEAPYPAPVREDSNLMGWYLDKLTTDEKKYDFDTPVTSSFTLFAKWSSGEVVGDKETKRVIIHYNGDAGNEWQNRELWLWGKDTEACIGRFVDDGGYGGKVDILLENFEGIDPATNNPTKRVFTSKTSLDFIIRSKGGWSWQTPDCKLIYAKYDAVISEDGTLELWLADAPGRNIDYFTSLKDASGDKFISVSFNSWSKASVKCTTAPSECALYEDGVKIKEINPSDKNFDISIDKDIELNKSYEVRGKFASDPSKEKKRGASFTALFDTEKFHSDYEVPYEQKNGKELGTTISDTHIIFRVWAPTSYKVVLNIYFEGLENKPATMFVKDMELTQKGIWEITVDRYFKPSGSVTNYDLVGRYYTYSVTNAEGINEVVDPYAKATGLNGARGMIVDLNAKTIKKGDKDLPMIPEGWDEIKYNPINNPTELVVYETHVRDLTDDDSWGGKTVNRGKYLGFVEEGTTYTSNKNETPISVKTGYDHLNELGVNAVQLLPVFDHANDEVKNDYNWGYNPLNYNAPEGAYSSNPVDGSRSVYELRELISGLSKTENNTRVIMDVVYNHTASSSSNFGKLVPGYYYRMDKNGGLFNGTGCGNDIYTQRPMMRRFIVESLLHWAKDYKMMGFRFDLMGLIDCDTLILAGKELYKVNPQIVMYGEPWMSYSSGEYYGDWNNLVKNNYAVTDNVYNKLQSKEGQIGIGAFNDQMREGLKGPNTRGGEGEYANYPGWGFGSQGNNDVNELTRNRVDAGMRGENLGKGGNTNQTVNYSSCHDNYSLYDTLYASLADTAEINNKPNAKPDLNKVADASVAINGLVLMSQGIPLIQGGEEIMRSKVEVKGNDGKYIGDKNARVNMYGEMITHNAYSSHVETSSLDYEKKVDFNSQFEDYAKLIDLRLAPTYKSVLCGTGYPNDNTVTNWGDDSGCALGTEFKNTNSHIAVLYTGREANNIGIGNSAEVIWCNKDIKINQKEGWKQFSLQPNTIVIVEL